MSRTKLVLVSSESMCDLLQMACGNTTSDFPSGCRVVECYMHDARTVALVIESDQFHEVAHGQAQPQLFITFTRH